MKPSTASVVYVILFNPFEYVVWYMQQYYLLHWFVIVTWNKWTWKRSYEQAVLKRKIAFAFVNKVLLDVELETIPGHEASLGLLIVASLFTKLSLLILFLSFLCSFLPSFLPCVFLQVRSRSCRVPIKIHLSVRLLYTCLYVWTQARRTPQWVFMKFDVRKFQSHVSTEANFGSNQTDA
jgi:hypothetical protein